MSNLTSNIYIGYVTEVLKDNNGQPTFELKVRIPTIHGVDNKTGVKQSDLPIARPLLMPGNTLNKDSFLEHIESINKVFIIFESGNFSKPFYLSIGNNKLYTLPAYSGEASAPDTPATQQWVLLQNFAYQVDLDDSLKIFNDPVENWDEIKTRPPDEANNPWPWNYIGDNNE